MREDIQNRTRPGRVRYLATRTLEIARLVGPAVRGTWCAAYFRLFRRDVRITLPLFAHEAVRISGPGRVRIGPWCSVHRNTSRGLSITTLARKADVEIGSHCSLGGTTIRCRELVTLGDRSRTAFCLIQDVPFCVETEGGPAARSAAAPVRIGSNAWLGAFSMVLAGTVVGNDSVVGWGSCCAGIEVPAGALAFGNPVSRPLPIARIVALRQPK